VPAHGSSDRFFRLSRIRIVYGWSLRLLTCESTTIEIIGVRPAFRTEAGENAGDGGGTVLQEASAGSRSCGRFGPCLMGRCGLLLYFLWHAVHDVGPFLCSL